MHVRIWILAGLTASVTVMFTSGCAVRRMEQESIPAWERPIELPAPIVRKPMPPATPLHAATEEGLTEAAIEAIKANKATVNQRGNDSYYPLHWAAWHGDQVVVKALLAAGANPNATTSKKQTPLHLAAAHNKKEVVDMLIANKASVDALDSSGLTPLYEVALMGHIDVAKTLIEAGANVNHAEPHHRITVLHRAARAGHLELIQVLLTSGAELDQKDDGGWSALYWASAHGHADVVRHLIQQAADLSVKDLRYSRTSLHQATMNRHRETVKALVEGGVDINATAGDGYTALDMAISRYKGKPRAPQIQHYLQKHGARRNQGG